MHITYYIIKIWILILCNIILKYEFIQFNPTNFKYIDDKMLFPTLSNLPLIFSFTYNLSSKQYIIFVSIQISVEFSVTFTIEDTKKCPEDTFDMEHTKFIIFTTCEVDANKRGYFTITIQGTREMLHYHRTFLNIVMHYLNYSPDIIYFTRVLFLDHADFNFQIKMEFEEMSWGIGYLGIVCRTGINHKIKDRALMIHLLFPKTFNIIKRVQDINSVRVQVYIKDKDQKGYYRFGCAILNNSYYKVYWGKFKEANSILKSKLHLFLAIGGLALVSLFIMIASHFYFARNLVTYVDKSDSYSDSSTELSEKAALISIDNV